MEKYKIISKDKESIDLIKSLWEKLNEHHKASTKYFEKRYEI